MPPSPLPPILSFQRLILKSPAHTARLKLLHEIFPKAKFIHISRNPYEVYQSTQKLYMDLLIQVCPCLCMYVCVLLCLCIQAFSVWSVCMYVSVDLCMWLFSTRHVYVYVHVLPLYMVLLSQVYVCGSMYVHLCELLCSGDLAVCLHVCICKTG